jgi:hypothetical protein
MDTQPILLGFWDGGQVAADARSGIGGDGRWHQWFGLVALHHCTAIPDQLVSFA